MVYQPWDFRPGGNFVLEMQKAAGEARKTVVVLSEDYLKADYTQPEWAAAFAQDPRGEHRTLIPLRVGPCAPTGLLQPLIYVDLVDLPMDEATAAVLAAVSDGRPKPAQPPAFPGTARPAPAYPGSALPPGPHLDLGRLPIPGPHFVGREPELARLDAAWKDPKTHVLTLVAFGGVGKSALVARWLDRMSADGWRGATRVLDWSFYSQGMEDRVTSAELFIDHALRFFGDPDPKAGSLHDRGARLASLIRKERSLIVLDGIEPLQYPPGRPEIEGRLKDPGLAALLKGLAVGNPGLCVVTPANGSPTSPATPARRRRSPWRNWSPARPWPCSASSAWTAGRASWPPRRRSFSATPSP